MYIDPNTGGIFFQILAVAAVCGLPLCGIGIVGGVIFFLNKNKKKDLQQDNNN